ncbi:MAG: hypothetical protein AAF483_04770 [Planctomycetota bacterium]
MKIRYLTIFLGLLFCNSLSAQQTKLADFRWELIEGTPAEEIVHSVKTKSQFDKQLRRTSLKGPIGLSIPQSATKDKTPAFMSWYKITYGGGDQENRLKIQDAISDKSYRVQIGEAKYFLSVAQRIETGRPKDEDKSLDLFKAYEIKLDSKQDAKIKRSETFFGGKEATAVPAFLCVPVEESHHQETFPIKNDSRCLVVYKCNDSILAKKSSLTIIDQFGLHRVQTIRSELVCVEAIILE